MHKTFAIISISLTLGALTVQATPPPVLHSITNITDLASADSGRINIGGTVGEAASFTTGGGTSTVYSVQMMLDAATVITTVTAPGQSGPTSQPRFTSAGYDALLFSNSGGEPGSQLYNLGATTSNPATNTLVTIMAPANTYLAANTTYWLVLEMSASGVLGGWQDTGTLSSSSPDGWTMASGYETIGNSTVLSGTPLYSIETTPEPGTLALAGLGAAALGWYRRRA